MSSDTLAGYHLVRQLSAGGMGVVYLACRQSAGGFEKRVAIKVMRANLFERPDIRQLFVDEARLVARLTHPNICQVHDFGEERGQYYLVMEYVDGLRLLDLVRDAARSGQAFPPRFGARILADAARGLHFAHELRGDDGALLGVVHRDISPENIIVTRQGFTKVLDFGIAKWADRLSVTLGDVVRGKPAYMSPEQVHGAPLDRRSDVFALGVVGYELLTGRPLFRRASVLATMEAVCDAPVDDPRALRSDLPSSLCRVLLHALARDPDARLPTALALTEELERFVDGSGPQVTSEGLAHHLERVVRPRVEAAVQPRDLPAAGASSPPAGAAAATTDARPPAQPARVTEALAPVAAVESSSSGRATLGSETAPMPTVPLPRRPRHGLSLVAAALALAAGVLALGRWRGDRTDRAPEADAAVLALATLGDASGSANQTPDAGSLRSVDAAQARDAAARDRRSPRGPPAATAAGTVDGGALHAVVRGQLTIAAEPWGQVRVDGVLRGPTPILKLSLAEGEHEIELLAPDSDQVRARRRVQVRAGQLLKVRF